MNCKKCGSNIPQKRSDMGYTHCVDCSSEPKASGHLIVHHKTGNEIQVIKDPETAAIMASMSARNGFGCKRRAIAKEGSDTKKKIVPKTDLKIEPKLLNKLSPDTSKWRDEAWTLAILDKANENIEESKALLDRAFNSGELSPIARKRLLVILTPPNS